MSELLAAMVAAGGPTCTDARDQWPVHRALVWLANHRPAVSALPELTLSDDPEVGVRTRGVTRSIWDLIGQGFFLVEEQPGQAMLYAAESGLYAARQTLMRLSVEDRAVVDQAAGIWAAAA